MKYVIEIKQNTIEVTMYLNGKITHIDFFSSTNPCDSVSFLNKMKNITSSIYNYLYGANT